MVVVTVVDSVAWMGIKMVDQKEFVTDVMWVDMMVDVMADW